MKKHIQVTACKQLLEHMFLHDISKVLIKDYDKWFSLDGIFNLTYFKYIFFKKKNTLDV